LSFLGALVVTLVALSQAPDRIGLYTYSRDSAAGFQDELLDVFRRELLKHASGFSEVAYSAREARVRVQFLGPGELEAELRPDDEPIRYFFRPYGNAPRTWALIRVGGFSKEFATEGSGARDLSRLAQSVAEWIRTNSTAIRERSLTP
jgi:hypothetical protein